MNSWVSDEILHTTEQLLYVLYVYIYIFINPDPLDWEMTWSGETLFPLNEMKIGFGMHGYNLKFSVTFNSGWNINFKEVGKGSGEMHD